VGGSPLLTACMGIEKWPIFWDKTRHEGLPSLSIYYRRMGWNQVRIRETLRLLCDAAAKRKIDTIAWIGSPGIANSASLNDVLMELLQNLGSPGFPPLIDLRVMGLIVLEWDAAHNKVEISVLPGKAGGAHSGWHKTTMEIGRKGGVLLVDPQEDEEKFAFHCPTVIALPNREATDRLRYNSKVGLTIGWMVVGPWTCEECEAAAFVECKMGRTDLTVEEVQERWTNVGGIPRLVLGEQRTYQNNCQYKRSPQSRIWTGSNLAFSMFTEMRKNLCAPSL